MSNADLAVPSQTLGVFGGTFDPVHNGHLILARALRDTFALPEVRLIPTGLPPHRPAPPVSPQQRFEWVQAAIAGEPGLTADDREVRRDGYCYTVDTLAELQQEHPDALLVWLVGGDSFHHLATWQRWRDLLECGHMVIAARPGYDWTTLSEELARELKHRAVPAQPDALGQGRISILPTPLMPFSSTELRDKLAHGEDVSGLTPVAQAIGRSGLYLT
ncbi:nicotinate-nucleotide adenylyltransferase [Silvimonas iriomotensis]|uniref:Probable nicotinate-nucleotide adenylyltransferase n=1 Tax=Silvimonas iriomotensis TaxID=449662 RepID=A0ABQ2PET8_9NEIS|nr:nicotinate-nucleotide adenylyltransferase [Silvimonas iriomotensis]GGP23769.1 putative nicotinate-nucleotide adenylyltransferase [Silvimonas iriomotensis]